MMARGTLSVICYLQPCFFRAATIPDHANPVLVTLIIQEVIVDDFNRINVEIAGDVFITQAAEQKVTVESNGNIISRLETIVDDGEWRIRVQELCQ